MLLEKNIPESTLSFDGTVVEFRDPTTNNKAPIINGWAAKKQVFVADFGNRCGHSPHAPRHYLRPDVHRSRPPVLEQAIRSAKEAYKLPKKLMIKLNQIHPKGKQKRSERREAIMAVSQALLHFVDLATLKVGFETSTGKFVYLDIDYIAKIAGLTYIRASRALRDLVKAGYLKLSRQFTQKGEGAFKGLPSLREITTQFFIDLGIDVSRLFEARARKRKEEEKKSGKKHRSKIKQFVDSLASVANKGVFLKPTVKTMHQPAQSLVTKAIIQQALDLHRAHPEISVSDYTRGLIERQIE